MHHKSSVAVTEKSPSYHEKRMSQEPIAKVRWFKRLSS